MAIKHSAQRYQLAQINIAQAKDEMDSEIMSGFVNRLDEINALAEQSEGFVWRLKSDEGDATSIRVFDDPLLIVNLSVWNELSTLRNFVYKSTHVELIRGRESWFNKMETMHQALWWIPEGHIPTTQEAKDKLESLRENGPTQNAFTFAKHFDPPKL